MSKNCSWIRLMIVLILAWASLPVSLVAGQSVNFEAGVYQAAEPGYGGDIDLTVEVSDTEILSIDTDHQETPGIGVEAIEALTDQVLSSQSLDVDVVAGATVSSEAFLLALTQALEEAGGDIEALKARDASSGQAESDISVMEADVVIIGGGGAGTAAAMSAHEQGATVILIEKMPALGGNTIRSGAAYNAVDPARQQALEMTDQEKETVEAMLAESFEDDLVLSWQETLAEDWQAYLDSGETYLFDSPSFHKLQTYTGGDREGNPALIDILGDGAYPAIEWLDEKGMSFTDTIFTVLGGLWNRAHAPELPLGTGYTETARAYFAEYPDEIHVYTDTLATSLIMEDGVVVGVQADHQGQPISFKAHRGVILATGGFGNDVEMRDEYNTLWPELTHLKTTNQPGATGEGIRMAQKVGAAVTDMEYIQLLPMGDPETGSLSGNIEQSVQDRIFVNKQGERFVDEGARRDVMTQALMEQEDSFMWTIVDRTSYPDGSVTNHFNETIDELVKAGRAFEADTIEDLALQIQVDPDTLVATVNEYNDIVAGKKEDPFGRTLFGAQIIEPPFYAAGRVPTVHHTMGGVVINEDTQVLDEAGDPIPGLYAAGEVTGDIHGTNRLGGNALTDINVFGIIAGKAAANNH